MWKKIVYWIIFIIFTLIVISILAFFFLEILQSSTIKYFSENINKERSSAIEKGDFGDYGLTGLSVGKLINEDYPITVAGGKIIANNVLSFRVFYIDNGLLNYIDIPLIIKLVNGKNLVLNLYHNRIYGESDDVNHLISSYIDNIKEPKVIRIDFFESNNDFREFWNSYKEYFLKDKSYINQMKILEFFDEYSSGNEGYLNKIHEIKSNRLIIPIYYSSTFYGGETYVNVNKTRKELFYLKSIYPLLEKK